MKQHATFRAAIVSGALGLALLAPTMPARAQAGGMPDLSDFAGAIAKSAEAAPKKAVPAGIFKSGLVVPSVKPGAGAREIGRKMRVAVEEQGGPAAAYAQLESEMPGILTALEKAFVQLGFAKRDMGVAYAYVFIDLLQTATKTEVPDAASKVAMRSLATAISKNWGSKWAKMPAADKESLYESMMMATTVNTLLATQFDKVNKEEEAAQLREIAGQLFEKLIGVPPSQVKIAPDGRISGLSAAPQE